MLPFGGPIDGTNESASTSIQVKSAVRFGVRATVGVETSLWCCCRSYWCKRVRKEISHLDVIVTIMFHAPPAEWCAAV